MPYAVLVSALGAIVAAAIAMLGMQSWTAFKVAPFLGALLGLFFAIFSLRRHQLPLGATVKTYRGVAGITEAPQGYLSPALGTGLIVACIELPSIMLGQETALVVWSAGLPLVLGVTIYCCWRLTHSPIRLDVFQIAGGIGVLTIFGAMLYPFLTSALDHSISPIDLAKLIVILNLIAALSSATLACLVLAIASSLGAIMDDSGR